jgi:hypothetical protein
VPVSSPARLCRQPGASSTACCATHMGKALQQFGK